MKILIGALLLLIAQEVKKDIPKAVKDAEAKLATAPDDASAHLVLGKFHAEMEEWEKAIPHLLKCKDKVLKAAAEKEGEKAEKAVQFVAMGDAWVDAAGKHPKLRPQFHGRAATFYVKAWPDIDGPWKIKLRERVMRLAASPALAPPRKGLPSGWKSEGHPDAVLDGTLAHSGNYSARIVATDIKSDGACSRIRSDWFVISGKTCEVSVWVLTNGTGGGDDRLTISFFNANGDGMYTAFPPLPTDLPFWKRIDVKLNVPEGAARVLLGIELHSKAGTIWADDASLKIDGKEILKAGGFDER
jgi:hypothetical protein